MSARIEEILEVLEEVRDNFRNKKGDYFNSQWRIDATKLVAKRWERWDGKKGIKSPSVSDKYARQLEPDIKGVDEFDSYLEKWLVNDSNELKNILLKHKSDTQDAEHINNFFYEATESEAFISQEFDLRPNENNFQEGKEQLKLHLIKERKPSLIEKTKAMWEKQQNGQVRCSICSFSFAESYAEIGEGFIEAHHVIPISSLTSSTSVMPSDLVPVCSNCHSMLHRKRPWLTVEQLIEIVRKEDN